jgi:hypothetical protein
MNCMGEILVRLVVEQGSERASDAVRKAGWSDRLACELRSTTCGPTLGTAG